MSASSRCPSCHEPLLPGASPDGLCPRCLLGVAMDGANDVALSQTDTMLQPGEALPQDEPETLDRLIGLVLDEKYLVERMLGEGGMGAVYLATQLGTQRPVALKVIAPRLMANAEFVERFKREARAVGRLRHPNIINVTDFGFAEAGGDQLAYLVMEYLDGLSLAQFLATNQRPPLDLVVDLLEQVSSAVGEAHERGVIHRDLKPGNIWLVPTGRDRFVVKVLDFGLAKLGGADVAALGSPAEPASVASAVTIDPDGSSALEPPTLPLQPSPSDPGARTEALPLAALTHAGAVLGTPQYMSPEQCLGARVDARSDIYSLGVIAYQMLAGVLPFKGDTTTLLAQHTARRPTAPTVYNPSVPSGVESVVLSALAKRPEDRPASAAAFARALRATAATRAGILWQAVGLLGRHLEVGFRLSVFGGYLPFAIVAAVTVSALARNLSQGLDVATPLLLGWAGLMLCFVYNGLATGSVFVPVVAQLLEAPDRPVQLRHALGILASSDIRSVLPSPAWVLVPIVVIAANTWAGSPRVTLGAGLATFAALLLWSRGPGRSIRSGRLIGPVVAVERLKGKAAHERAAQLAERLSRLYGEPYGLALNTAAVFALAAIALVQFPAFVLESLADPIIRARLGLGWLVAGSVGLASMAAVALLANALTGIYFALAYLKARELGGEPINTAMLPIRAVYDEQTRVTAVNPAYHWVFWGLAIVCFIPETSTLGKLPSIAGGYLIFEAMRRLASAHVTFRVAGGLAIVLFLIPGSKPDRSIFEERPLVGNIAVGDLGEFLPERVADASLERVTSNAEEIGRGRAMIPLSASNRVLGHFSDGTTVQILRYGSKQEALDALDAKAEAEYGVRIVREGRKVTFSTQEPIANTLGEVNTEHERSVAGTVTDPTTGTSRSFALSWTSTRTLSNPFNWTTDTGLGDGVLVVVEGRDVNANERYLDALGERAGVFGPAPGTVPLSDLQWFSWFDFVEALVYTAIVVLVCTGIAGTAKGPDQAELVRAARARGMWFAVAAVGYLTTLAIYYLNVDRDAADPVAITALIAASIAWLVANLFVLNLIWRAAGGVKIRHG